MRKKKNCQLPGSQPLVMPSGLKLEHRRTGSLVPTPDRDIAGANLGGSSGALGNYDFLLRL